MKKKEPKYNRVTGVLDALNSSWKEWWHRSRGFVECDRVRDESTTFGKKVHKYLEEHFTAKPGTVLRQPETKEEICAWNIDAWLTSHEVKRLQQEVAVVDKKLRLIGHFDLLAEINGEKVLIDYKTSKKHKEEYGFQLAAYAYLIKKTLGIDVTKGLILRVDKETGIVDPKEYTDLKKRWKIFLGGYKYYLSVK